jgi:hypothetical protein
MVSPRPGCRSSRCGPVRLGSIVTANRAHNLEGRKCRRWPALAFLVVAAAWSALAAASAQATVTVGSPLTEPLVGSLSPGDPVTFTNLVLPEPGANVTSPVAGTVVRWRIIGASGGPFHLRVLTQAGGTSFTGAGTSEPRTPSSTAMETFTTSLPIGAGQQIGLDVTNGTDQIGLASSLGKHPRFGFVGPPPLADGATQEFSLGASDEELLFNADVAPSNTFSVGAATRNKKKGTATLNLSVPNAGDLTATGSGVSAASSGRAVISKSVSAGGAQLLIKAAGKKKRKLNKAGNVKLTVAVTYTPTNGDPNTEPVQVKLKKR